MSVHQNKSTGSHSAVNENIYLPAEPIPDFSSSPESVDIDAIYDPPSKHSLHSHASFQSHTLDNPYVMHAINQHNRICMIPTDHSLTLATINVHSICERHKFLSVVNALSHKNIDLAVLTETCLSCRAAHAHYRCS